MYIHRNLHENWAAVEAAVVEMSAADGEVGQRGQAEIKEARVLTRRCPNRTRTSGTSFRASLPDRALCTICFICATAYY